jgi:hypothetical protein
MNMAYHLFLDLSLKNGDLNGVAVAFYMGIIALVLTAFIERKRK